MTGLTTLLVAHWRGYVVLPVPGENPPVRSAKDQTRFTIDRELVYIGFINVSK